MFEHIIDTEQKYRKPKNPAVRPNVETNDKRIDLTKTDTSSWPKSYIRDKIRQVLSNLIVDLISILAQHLKRQIKICLDSAINENGSDSDQEDLSSFSNKTADTTPPKKPETGDPGGSGDPEDDDTHDSDDTDESETEDEDDRPVGMIYARVSSEGQTDDDDNDDDDDEDDGEIDSGSIKGQIDQMLEIAEKLGIRIPYDAFTDKAETGRNFDREGIKNIFRTAQKKDCDHLLVEKVDRIGRNAAETLYFISVLQRECGVTLVTQEGEKDVGENEGLMHTTLMSLMAEIQNDLRITKAKKERVRGFLEKNNWKCSSPSVPLGYTETDDGWLTVDSDEKDIVREIFRKFTECECYAETRRHIKSEFDEDALNGHIIKTLLQQEAYIGKPQIPEEWIEDTSFDENVVDDPELNLLEPEDGDSVSEATFDEAQAIIEQKSQTDDSDEEPYRLTDFVDEFGLFPTVEASGPAKLIHHCGEPMVKAGQVGLGGKFDITTHRYMCPACEETEDPSDYYRKWPKQHEAEKMDLIREILESAESVYDSVTEAAAAIRNRDDEDSDKEESDTDDEETDSDNE